MELGELLASAPRAPWGKYAAAVADRRQNHITLVTDPLRQHHLFYARSPRKAWVFATRISDLMALLGGKPSYNMTRILEFLRKGTSDYSLKAETPFSGVYSVAGGTAVSLDENGAETQTYYSPYDVLDPAAPNTSPEELQAVLSDSTRAVTRSADHLNLHLSGGIDSSAVAWAATRTHSSVSAKHFMLAENTPGGEWSYARSVAEHLQIPLSPHFLNDGFAAALQPITPRSEPYPMYTLLGGARKANETSAADTGTLTLTGNGGDAVFHNCDYPWHVHDLARTGKYRDAWRQMYEFCLTSGAPLASVIQTLWKTDKRRRAGVFPAASDIKDSFRVDDCSWITVQRPRDASPCLWPKGSGAARMLHIRDIWSEAFTYSCEVSPHDYARFHVPLALPIVELMLRTPMRQLANWYENNRFLLRAAMRPHLPRDVVERWSKGEGAAAVQKAFQLRMQRAETLLREGVLASENLIDVDGAIGALRRTANGVEDGYLRSTLALELWFESWK